MKKQKVWQLIPDLLTWSRPFFGLLIGISGPLFGQEGVTLVLRLLVTGWTTDILDGRLARYAKKHHGRHGSWTGRNEIRFDSLMLVGLLVYLGYTHLIPVWLGISSASFLFALAMLSSYKKIFFFESLIAMATFLFLAYLAGRTEADWLVVWAFLVFIYDRERAMQLGGKLKKLLGQTVKEIARFFSR